MTQTDRNIVNILPKVGSRQHCCRRQMWNHFYNHLGSPELREWLAWPLRKHPAWLNQTNHRLLDCALLPWWAPWEFKPVSVMRDTTRSQPSSLRMSREVLSEGENLIRVANEHAISGTACGTLCTQIWNCKQCRESWTLPNAKCHKSIFYVLGH